VCNILKYSSYFFVCIKVICTIPAGLATRFKIFGKYFQSCNHHINILRAVSSFSYVFEDKFVFGIKNVHRILPSLASSLTRGILQIFSSWYFFVAEMNELTFILNNCMIINGYISEPYFSTFRELNKLILFRYTSVNKLCIRSYRRWRRWQARN
jgi:hypothetical protein